MKSLENFYESYITEATKKYKNEADVDNDPVVKNAVDAEDVDAKHLKKKAEKAFTWEVDDPLKNWEKEWVKFDIAQLSKEEKRLCKCLDYGTDFFIQGRAGWAKTATIETLAKQQGYSVLTVYLDKAQASDLGGIPVPEKQDDGHIQMKNALSGWVIEMLKHPKKKYLLFFDEMNQAQPDVLNALMPIILRHVICGIKFDNFLVGAAGNESYENENGLSEMSVPLAARLREIKWPSRTPEAWEKSFKYLHSVWDAKVGETVINAIHACSDILSAPRDIERYLLKDIADDINRHKQGSAKVYDDADEYLDAILTKCVPDDGDVDKNSRTFERKVNELADTIVQCIRDAANGGTKKRGQKDNGLSKEEQTARQKDYDAIKNALINGYFYNSSENDGGDNENYVVTAENAVTNVFDPDVTGVTAEVLRKMIRTIEAEGKSVKYQTNADAKKDAKANNWIWAMASTGDFAVTGHIVSDKPAQQAKRTQRRHTND